MFCNFGRHFGIIKGCEHLIWPKFNAELKFISRHNLCFFIMILDSHLKNIFITTHEVSTHGKHFKRIESEEKQKITGKFT